MAVAATVLVLVPWVVRNAITLDKPVVFTTNSGHTAAATVCDDTFRAGSPYLGFVRHQCALGTGPCAAIADELDQAACQRDAAWRYMRDHAGRVPVVLAVRVLRVWELYRYQDDLGYGELWSRSIPVAKAGLVMYALMLVLAIGGLVRLRRARIPVWPLLMLAVLVSLSAAMTFGFSRYRLAAEIPLVLLAGAGLDWGVAVLGARHRRRVAARACRGRARWVEPTGRSPSPARPRDEHVDPGVHGVPLRPHAPAQDHVGAAVGAREAGEREAARRAAVRAGRADDPAAAGRPADHAVARGEDEPSAHRRADRAVGEPGDDGAADVLALDSRVYVAVPGPRPLLSTGPRTT